jgi:hypothetical protein
MLFQEAAGDKDDEEYCCDKREFTWPQKGQCGW